MSAQENMFYKEIKMYNTLC